MKFVSIRQLRSLLCAKGWPNSTTNSWSYTCASYENIYGEC